MQNSSNKISTKILNCEPDWEDEIFNKCKGMWRGVQDNIKIDKKKNIDEKRGVLEDIND